MQMGNRQDDNWTRLRDSSTPMFSIGRLAHHGCIHHVSLPLHFAFDDVEILWLDDRRCVGATVVSMVIVRRWILLYRSRWNRAYEYE